MVRVSRVLLRDARVGINKTLSEILVCPLSKQPLRVCEESGSLISDAIGVSYPVVDGIPSLVPKDGKILATDDIEKPDSDVALDSANKEYPSVGQSLSTDALFFCKSKWKITVN
ncbi:hypothetical protein PVL29_005182 [Vitis rotundifolia]|uniref:Protein preY, mitochondrial n=1 Tax=Vitis rotundifolia TaxID=103349 RepID=A0AA39ACC0_VITRO|nr:hypothetical protein PVL29_005182 [Vitis rotundifolia]